MCVCVCVSEREGLDRVGCTRVVSELRVGRGGGIISCAHTHSYKRTTRMNRVPPSSPTPVRALRSCHHHTVTHTLTHSHTHTPTLSVSFCVCLPSPGSHSASTLSHEWPHPCPPYRPPPFPSAWTQAPQAATQATEAGEEDQASKDDGGGTSKDSGGDGGSGRGSKNHLT